MKKIISIVLVLATILGMCAITASAASYTTGLYSVNANSGSNVRPQPNSKSRVGAASKGTEFYVSKINGNWGYTESIRCANNTTQKGWVCLDYCVKKSSNPAPSSNYPTGTYTPSSTSGSNVRYGAGTNYGKVGAVKFGTLFTVTKVSGEFGYSPDVKCTNGKVGGWVSLKYCTYKPSTPAPTPKPTGKVIKLNVPLMKQSDSRWKNVKIGTKTIGAIGCTTTCCAMVYSYNTGRTVYPHQVKNMLRYSNNDLYWSSIGNIGLTSKAYNCGVSNSILKAIYNQLKEGRPVIVGATNSNGNQHWTVVVGFTGTSTTNFSTADFLVNDPGYSYTTLKDFLANGSKADRTKIIRIVY